ncbi:hypothetical protein GGF44_003050 [Coemansia sp. RSA 1694]|nr:hypothetical protein GGF44_003050 [Coemansia sp. RSA 1694]
MSHGRPGGGNNDYDIEFKAGRLYRDGDTNWVRPDLRRGTCFVKSIGSGAVRLRWIANSNEDSGRPAQEEYVFFSGDAVAEKVAQAGASAEEEERVYVIKSKSTSTRLFFWLQGDDGNSSQAAVGALNACLEGGAGDEYEDEDEDEDEDGNDDAELREALALSRRSGEQLAVARETASAGDLRGAQLATAQVGGSRRGGDDVVAGAGGGLGQLRQILSGFRAPPAAPKHALQLGDVLSAEHVAPVLADAQARRALRPTLGGCVAGDSARDFERVVRSPQFRQALAALSQLLEGGQIAAVVAQLGLDPRAATSVAAFLDAVAEKAGEEDGDVPMEEEI